MLNTKSLREQVYEYLRDEINNRKLLPGAAAIIRDVHWSFKVQEKYIRQFYPNANGFG